MSAALKKSLASNKLVVRKVVSGECAIVFRNPVRKTEKSGLRYQVNLDPVRISHNNPINLFDREEVDAQSVGQSNLQELVQKGVLEVVL